MDILSKRNDIGKYHLQLHPEPGKEKYYAGGHNQKIHAGIYNERVDGLQIEIPLLWRNPKEVPAVSKALSKALSQWVGMYYDVESQNEPFVLESWWRRSEQYIPLF